MHRFFRYGLFRALFNAAVVLTSIVLVPLPVAAEPGETVILAFGDSLTAGYGLDGAEAFPARLEAHLRQQGLAVRVINGGVSGDTSTGGRARLDWALADKPAVVIVELGANDALRGIEPDVTRKNLNAILRSLKTRKIKILLTGMLAPPNLGTDYGDAFNSLFPDLAAKYDVAFYPFFLEGVAAEPGLNQPDGMHPNAKGVEVIVEGIAPMVRRLIEQSSLGG